MKFSVSKINKVIHPVDRDTAVLTVVAEIAMTSIFLNLIKTNFVD